MSILTLLPFASTGTMHLLHQVHPMQGVIILRIKLQETPVQFPGYLFQTILPSGYKPKFIKFHLLPCAQSKDSNSFHRFTFGQI